MMHTQRIMNIYLYVKQPYICPLRDAYFFYLLLNIVSLEIIQNRTKLLVPFAYFICYFLQYNIFFYKDFTYLVLIDYVDTELLGIVLIKTCTKY